MSKDAKEATEDVRIYFEDDNFQIANVNPKTTTIEELWEVVGDSLGLRVETAQNFFIWGVEDDLEILLYADSTVEQVRKDWPTYMAKWSNNAKPKTGIMATMRTKKKRTQNSEIELNTLYGVRFVFKRTSIVTLSAERNTKNDTATYLLYTQAAKNVYNSNYPCDVETAIQLAGLQMQFVHGDRNPVVHRVGFLRKQILAFLPRHLHTLKKPEEWEDLIYKIHGSVTGKDPLISQMLYLQLVRQWPYYGCTFFRGRFVPNTEAFFQQHFSGEVVIGINSRGIHLMDPIVLKVISVEFDQVDAPQSDDKIFAFTQRKKDGPPEQFIFKTKQGHLINDLLHDWFIEFKKQRSHIDRTRSQQRMSMSLSMGHMDAALEEVRAQLAQEKQEKVQFQVPHNEEIDPQHKHHEHHDHGHGHHHHKHEDHHKHHEHSEHHHHHINHREGKDEIGNEARHTFHQERTQSELELPAYNGGIGHRTLKV